MPNTTFFEQLARTIVLQPPLRGPAWQPLWTRLHRLSLWGMNAGPGGSVLASGEEWALRWCAGRSPAHRPFVLLDAGANVGDYTASACEIAGSRLDAHCFEPSAETFRVLSKNLGRRPNVHLSNFGLSDGEGTATLYSHLGGCKEASVVRRDLSHWGLDQSKTESIGLRRLDDYCRDAGLNRIDLLKIDVEGHELSVLRGAGDLLNGIGIRHVQFEFGSPDIESRTFFKDLFHALNPHYRIHRVVYCGLHPIDTYSEFHENFVTTNFLAVTRQPL